MPSNPTFREADLTAGQRPSIAMPPIPGGFFYAVIGATFTMPQDGKQLRVVVRERAKFANRKVVAVCIGKRTGGTAMEPCPVCSRCEATGEDGLETLKAKHVAAGCSDMDLRKRNEQHVFALFCAEALEPELHKFRVADYEEKLKALKECKSALERQALVHEFGYDPRFSGPPVAEIVGLLGEAIWGDSGTPVTM